MYFKCRNLSEHLLKLRSCMIIYTNRYYLWRTMRVINYSNMPYEGEGFGYGRGWKELPNQSGWSIAVRGEGVLDESWLNKRFFWVIFHPVKAQEAQEMHICPKVKGLQNSHVNAVGWDNICHRARLQFCKLVRHMWFIGFTV